MHIPVSLVPSLTTVRLMSIAPRNLVTCPIVFSIPASTKSENLAGSPPQPSYGSPYIALLPSMNRKLEVLIIPC